MIRLASWACCLALALPANAAFAAKLRLAAASSLQFVMADVIEQFESKGRHQVQPVYGASGNLYRQIVQGAPYDVFLSADAELLDKLDRLGKLAQPAVEFGRGRLVLYRSQTADWVPNAAATALTALAAEGGTFKLAIANPRHAPYGRAAQQVLQNLDLWQVLQPNLVYGEKVSQSAMMVASGAAAAGLISLTLARSPQLRERGAYALIDSEHHEPLWLKAAVVATQADKQHAAAALLGYLQSASAKAIFKRFGLHAE